MATDRASELRFCCAALIIAGLAVAAPARAEDSAQAPATTAAKDSHCTVVAHADSPAASFLPQGVVGRVTFRFAGLDSAPEEACQRLARYVRLGPPPYDRDDADEVERLLVDVGYFQAAYCRPVNGEPRLRCDVVPRPIIRDVEIRGSLPFSMLEQDIRRRIFLRPGVLPDEVDAPAQQIDRLQRFFTEEGYFDTRVEVRFEPMEGAAPNRGVRLVVEIDPGRRLFLRHVAVRGGALDEEEVRRRLARPAFLFWGLERFKPGEFEEDVRRLAAWHREHGWPEARVTGNFARDDAAGAVDALIEVDAGPELVLEVRGNRALSDADLGAVASFAEAGVVDTAEVEATALAMLTLYQREGYYDAQLTGGVVRRDEAQVVVRYEVDEGPEAEIVEVRFENAPEEPEVELATEASGLLFSGRWVEEDVVADSRAVETWLEEHGYREVSVEARRELRGDGELAAVFSVQAQRSGRVADVSFAGLPRDLPSFLVLTRLALRPGAPFVPEHLDDDRRAMAALLAENGYSHATLEQEVEGGEGDGPVKLRYVIDAGPRANFAGVLVLGNFRTDEGLIEQEIGLDAGAPLDLSAIGGARRRLRELGIFGSVDLAPLGTWRGDADTWLVARVQEREQRALDAVVGFATDEMFSVGADYRDRNLFGRAVRLDLELRLGNASELLVPQARIGNVDRGQLVLRVPTPLGLPFDLQGSGLYRYEDKPLFTERRIGLATAISRELLARDSCDGCPGIAGTFGYELISTQFTGEESLALEDTASRGTIGRLVPELAVDGRDSFIDPRSGYVFEARLELANEAFAMNLQNASSFVRVILGAQTYLTLDRGPRRGSLGGPVVLALGGTFGTLQRLSDANPVPLSETFFYGGDFNTRGLPERASTRITPGARQLASGTLELRWYFWQDVGLGTLQVAGFADAATVSYELNDLGSEVTVTAGPVARYVTPVGPISLAYGRPVVLVPGLPAGGRFHLSFGYSF